MAKNKEKQPKEEELEEENNDLEKVENDFGEVLAYWEFLEYEKPERSRKWYVWFIIIFLILIVLSLSEFKVTLFKYADQPFDISFYQNPLFIILLALFALVYFYNEKKGPDKLAVAIAEDGVIIEDRLIEYKDLENFYIVYQPPGIKNLYFQPKNHFKPLIMIPLEDQNPVQLRNILLEFLEEDLDKEDEPASDGLSRALKL